MNKKSDANALDLEKEQADFLTLLEKSVSPQLLDAVDKAYHAADDLNALPAFDISFAGATTCLI